MDRIENDASNNSSIVAHIRCRGNFYAEPLPSNDRRGYTQRHTDWWEGFMKYAVEMGSCAMMYIPRFIKTCSAIQTLIRRIHRQHSDRISLVSFFKIRKVGWKSLYTNIVSNIKPITTERQRSTINPKCYYLSDLQPLPLASCKQRYLKDAYCALKSFSI
jgi:hypothetical protein